MFKPGFSNLPLYFQVVIAVLAGSSFGVIFGSEPYFFGLLGNATLGQLGQLVIRMLKALATPLIFFAIVDALINTDVDFRHGKRLLTLCGTNLLVAMAIGLTLMNVFKPGLHWQGRLEDLMAQLPENGTNLDQSAAMNSELSLNPMHNLASYIPESLVKPFVDNNVVGIILLALLIGSALRKFRHQALPDEQSGLAVLEKLISIVYQLLIQILLWIVRFIPFAVFGVVAQVVGRSGLAVFELLAVFLLAMLAGLSTHALIYYPCLAKWGGGMPIKLYFGLGADAILTGLSTNSSLATIPVTLRCLTEKWVFPTDRQGCQSASALI